MVIDHIYKTFMIVFPIWLNILGRFVAPVFAYLMVDGFHHTRSEKNIVLDFTLRLLLWNWAI